MSACARARKRNATLNRHSPYIRPVNIATRYIIYRLRCSWNILLRNIVPLRIILLHVLIFVLHLYVVDLFFLFFFFFFWLASPFNEPSVFHWKSKSRVALFNLTNVSILYSFFFFLYNYECRKKIRNADPLSFSRVRYAKIREDSRRYVN